WWWGAVEDMEGVRQGGGHLAGAFRDRGTVQTERRQQPPRPDHEPGEPDVGDAGSVGAGAHRPSATTRRSGGHPERVLNLGGSSGAKRNTPVSKGKDLA